MGVVLPDVMPVMRCALKAGKTREEALALTYDAMLPMIRSPRIRRRLLARLRVLRGPEPKANFATLRLEEGLLITRWRNARRWWNPLTWRKPI